MSIDNLLPINITYSNDLCELRAKILKLNMDTRNAFEKEGYEEAFLIEEKTQHLTKRLHESDEQLFSLTNKLRTLIGNYAAFSSVLELKHELSLQVKEFKEKNVEITEKFNEEVARLKKKVEETKDTWTNILAVSHEENKKKLDDIENSCEKKLEAKEEELRSVKENLQEVRENCTNTVEILKRQHHEEMENLRSQIELMQRSNSSSSLDIYAQKLYSAKCEFDRSLLERDTTINDLKAKLKEAQDNIRYLKLLSVVRSAQKAPQAVSGHEEERNKGQNSSKRNEHQCYNNREASLRTSNKEISVSASGINPQDQKKKSGRKRKLFSRESSFLNEPSV